MDMGNFDWGDWEGKLRDILRAQHSVYIHSEGDEG